MRPEQYVLLMVKGAIAELPPADQAAVKQAEAQIRAVIAQNEPAGVMALALVSAEIDAKG